MAPTAVRFFLLSTDTFVQIADIVDSNRLLLNSFSFVVLVLVAFAFVLGFSTYVHINQRVGMFGGEMSNN